jgi:hypothetical protein
MSTVLFIVGALALIGGAALAGFGIPVSEFSFGNTLIMAGATTATGGLIVIALGAVVSQLQRLNEALAAPAMPAHQHEPFEAAALGQPAEPHPFEPRGPSTPPEFPMPAPAPVLRNPDEPVEVAEEVSLSPQTAVAEPIDQEPPEEPREPPPWMRSRPAPEPVKEERPRSSFFDSMWPPENKMFGRTDEAPPAGETAEQPPPLAGPEPEHVPEAELAEPEPAEPAVQPAEEAPRPRAIAILKSGVVDGMSYTLYVDGSIEAELPQGTLRFASIHELRAHLEQNG